MPYFYFDTRDGQSMTEDEYGIELSGPREALSVAVNTLPDLAQSMPASPKPNSVGVRVRGEGGGILVEVSLNVVIEWANDDIARSAAKLEHVFFK